MMDITLIVNGLDISKKLATYSVDKEVRYRKVITTLDDTEHPVSGSKRTVLQFTLLPMTDEESGELEAALEAMVFESTFTVNGVDRTEDFRLDSDLQNLFLLKSVDGKRRYRGGKIILRGVRVANC
jgi:hypothetical protein